MSSLHIKLSEGDAVLTFCPHFDADTATFDVVTANPNCADGRAAMPPDYKRFGHSICTNIDPEAAVQLRDALTEWLAKNPERAA